MKFLVFDTETTGLPKGRDPNPEDTHLFPHIVQLSWLVFNSGTNKIDAMQDKIIRLPNNVRIPQKATEIHGITQERMIEDGLPIESVLNTFMRDVSSCTYLIGHNINFDKSMIEVECIRNKCRRLSYYRKISFCTMIQGQNVCCIKKKYACARKAKIDYKYPKLIELHKHLFNTTPSNLHNSLIDVLVCFRCFYSLIYDEDPMETNQKFAHHCKTLCGL